MSMISPLENPIPPEALSLPEPGNECAADAHPTHRFAEHPPDSVTWSPDFQPQPRLADSESLQLEKRGLTSHVPGPGLDSRKPSTQSELWRTQTVFKNTIAAKLREQGVTDLADKLECCHTYYTVARCNDCGSVTKFPNRCDLFCCPECANHLQRDRVQQVEWWTHTLSQPKHVVLTVRNTEQISRGHIKSLQTAFARLRRQKVFSGVRGGFYRIEITNEGKGWHLHIHALVEARWIDAPSLAIAWNKATRGEGCIVKVRDCRKGEYLREVTKYLAKPQQVASWSAPDVAAYVLAFAKARTFGVFGSLYGMRTEFAEVVAELKQSRPRCTCGSCSVSYFSENEWSVLDAQLVPDARPRPPTPDFAQLDLLNVTPLFRH